MVFKALYCNLLTSYDLDYRDQKNKAMVRVLSYRNDTEHWTLEIYITQYIDCHNDQKKLNKHAYQDIIDRNKVTYLLNGVKSSEWHPVIMQINADTAVRVNFDKAQKNLFDYMAITENRRFRA